MAATRETGGDEGLSPKICPHLFLPQKQHALQETGSHKAWSRPKIPPFRGSSQATKNLGGKKKAAGKEPAWTMQRGGQRAGSAQCSDNAKVATKSSNRGEKL